MTAPDYKSELFGNAGGRTADCVGLIKGYGWYNSETGVTEIGSGGMPDVGADGMYNAATKKGAIDTIPEISGLAVWHEGHIGIYIVNGEVKTLLKSEPLWFGHQ